MTEQLRLQGVLVRSAKYSTYTVHTAKSASLDMSDETLTGDQKVAQTACKSYLIFI